MDRATRFGISVPRNLLKKFDETIRKLGYANRSKAIQDAICDFITNKRWEDETKHFIGTISYAYDHHTGDVTQKLTSIQHDFSGVIKSTMHSHITHADCVEVLIVSGRPAEIKKLYNLLSATRGVVNCKMSKLTTKE